MNTMHKMTTLIATAAMLGACSSAFDPQFGDAVDNNTQVQILNHDPGYASNTATLEGQKAEKLLGEYRKEKTDAPTQTLIRIE